MNFEIFSGSRLFLSLIWAFLFSVIFSRSCICIILIPVVHLATKNPHYIIRQIPLLGITILCFWIVNGGFLSKTLLPVGSDLLKFDSAVWKKDESEPLPKNLVTARQKMLKDLVKKILPGKSRDEIMKLLGPSTQTSNFRGKYDLIYVLGPQRDIGIDYEWLLIYLKNQKFEKYSIEND